jgi:hypothetical protein
LRCNFANEQRNSTNRINSLTSDAFPLQFLSKEKEIKCFIASVATAKERIQAHIEHHSPHPERGKGIRSEKGKRKRFPTL